MANVGGDQMTQGEIRELSGVALARAVAEAVGWKYDWRENAIMREGIFYPFKPQSSADDAFAALKEMKVWHLEFAKGAFGRTWRCVITRRRGVAIEAGGVGDTFSEALSRAIIAAHEAEVKDGK